LTPRPPNLGPIGAEAQRRSRASVVTTKEGNSDAWHTCDGCDRIGRAHRASSLIARVPATAAALSDGPVLVETDSNIQLECYLNGGEWSTTTNQCVMEQPG